MPYARILEELLRSINGARAALLLDSEGEVVVDAGPRDDRHRLIGAYQGIALASIRRLAGRYDWGGVRHVVCRYAEGTLILRPLRDGYYLVVALSAEGLIGQGLHQTDAAEARMNQEL
jgi:predicted regulator of Ras-like GTPase activity (Roadblock/LC7/MglB family)